MLQGAFRGLGDTRTPLYATLLCNAINIGLNYVLLFVLHLGVAGSAWATVSAEVRWPSLRISPSLSLCVRARACVCARLIKLFVFFKSAWS